MKKIVKILTVAISALLVLTACSGKSETKDISVADTTKSVLEATTLVGELVEISDKNVDLLYTKFDKSIIGEYKIYACASKATCEEIAIFKATDKENVEKITEIAKQRVADLITENKDYNPNEMTKLDSPLITSKGNYVLLVIADDTAPAQEAFSKAFK